MISSIRITKFVYFTMRISSILLVLPKTLAPIYTCISKQGQVVDLKYFCFRQILFSPKFYVGLHRVTATLVGQAD